MAKQTVTVEFFYDDAWHTVPALPSDAEGGQDIVTVRGQPPEGMQDTPCRIYASLDNSDGSANFRNPNSPLFGKVQVAKPGRPGTPTRVTVGGSVRCIGQLVSAVPEHSNDARHAWVRIEAAGIGQTLGADTTPAQDALTRFLRDETPHAWWPLNDPDGSLEARSLVAGVGPLKASGESRFQEPVTGQPRPPAGAPSFGRGELGHLGSGYVSLTSGGELSGALPLPASTRYTIEVTLQFPRKTIDEVAADGFTATVLRVVMDPESSPTASHWDIVVFVPTDPVNFPPDVRVAGFTLGSTQGDPWYVFDGLPHTYTMLLEQNGGNIQSTMLVDGVLLGTQTDSGTLGKPAEIIINVFNQSGDRMPAVGHVRAWAGTAANTAGASTGHVGETPGERLLRLSGEEDVPLQVVGSLDDDGPPMGPQPVGTFLDLVRQCVATGRGLLYDQRDQVGWSYRTLQSLYSQDPVLTLDYEQHHVSPPLLPVFDDQVAGETDVSTVNAMHPMLAANIAAWAGHLAGFDGARFPLIRVDLVANPGLVDDVDALEIGDRVLVENLPAFITPDPVSVLVLGITETVGTHSRTVDLVCVPEMPHQIAQVAAEGVQFVGATMAQEALTGVEPASVRPGDLLLAVTMNDGAPLTGPAGWTLQAQVQGGGFGTVSQVWTLVRGTSPPDLEWSSTAPDFPVVAVHAWRHAELISPVLAVAESTVAPSQTAPSSGATLVCLYTDSSWLAAQEPPGMTRRDVAAAFSDQLIVAEQRVGAGPTGTREFVGADPSGSFSVLLGSATPPPGPGDPVRVDTAGCETLAPFVAGTETTLDVATLVGPVWTSDPDDLPFDINAAGARLRVTAVDRGVVEEFTGTAVDGWGATDTGQPWVTLGGDPADYAKGAGVGTMRETDLGGPTRRALLDGMPADLEILWAASVPEVSSGVAAQVAALVREHNDNLDFIAFRLVLLTNGNVDARISIRQAGVETTLANPPGVQAAYGPGTVLWARCRAAGEQLLMRCWADGDPEPTIWQAVATDPAFVGVAGRAGLRAALDPGWTGTLPLTFTFHHFEVTTVQRLTVEQQPINGVHKTVPAGSPVRLWTPARIGL